MEQFPAEARAPLCGLPRPSPALVQPLCAGAESGGGFARREPGEGGTQGFFEEGAALSSEPWPTAFMSHKGLVCGWSPCTPMPRSGQGPLLACAPWRGLREC